jgi:hypothetical protein
VDESGIVEACGMSEKRKSWLYIALLVLSPVIAFFAAGRLSILIDDIPNGGRGRAKDIVIDTAWEIEQQQQQ